MIKDLFFQRFCCKYNRIYRAPGRINLIGEHIDYNGGIVLPCAISKYTYLYVSIRSDDIIHIASTNFNNSIERSINNLEYDKSLDWSIYALGALYILQSNGYKITKGLNILIDSNIPMGSGLSSSASLIDAMLYMANDIFKFNIDKIDLIKYAKDVENVYCHIQTGIMDQASIMLGEENKAIFLDCKTLKYEYVNALLDDYSFAILQTNVQRKLIESKYNDRVDECNKALEIIKKNYKDVNYLADLSVNDLNNIERLLNDSVLFRRVKHVITEQQRVYDFKDALAKMDYQLLGKLLNESHESLKNDYEVTGIYLDTICDIARHHAIGARMVGAGFGGCAIALVKTSEFELFKEEVIKKYQESFGIKANVYCVSITSGPIKVEGEDK